MITKINKAQTYYMTKRKRLLELVFLECICKPHLAQVSDLLPDVTKLKKSGDTKNKYKPV